MSGTNDKVQALAEFFERRQEDLLCALEHTIPPLLKRTVSARDILQSAFIEVAGGLDKFGELSETELFGFVLRSSRSRMVDAVRREFCIRRGAGRIEHPTALLAIDNGTPSRIIARSEAVAAMIGELKHLNERQLQMTQLYFVGGLSYKAIGELLGGDAVSVRFVLLRVRRRLASLMGSAERYFTDA